MKNHEVKFLISEEKYEVMKEYIKAKEYDSIASMMRYLIRSEMKRNPAGVGKPKKNKNVKLRER